MCVRIVLRPKCTQAFLDPDPMVTAYQHNLLIQEGPGDMNPFIIGIVPAQEGHLRL